MKGPRLLSWKGSLETEKSPTPPPGSLLSCEYGLLCREAVGPTPVPSVSMAGNNRMGSGLVMSHQARRMRKQARESTGTAVLGPWTWVSAASP